ncbi:MAG: DNA-formamidopyrimidine glycosylase [Bacilli bacterium]|nr:DNA-formamidopyrimidine glycosylase [Bacilli bacterium]
MPELPEVETVKETLKKEVLNKKIVGVNVYYKNIIAYPVSDLFIKSCIGKTILDIKRKGKWILFDLGEQCLLSHLRMEGKYYIRDAKDSPLRHEHVCFIFSDGTSLRYLDTRKFGRMYVLEKENVYKQKPLSELGLEPFDENLTVSYLKEKYKKKNLPIKTVLLDQTIVTGIGNIYADEILFLSKINPLKKCSSLTKKECQAIIDNTIKVLKKAITLGGTTIRSYTSSEGVHGKFQNELFVHNHEKEPCPVCRETIIKIKVGGRGTYYCPICQK